MMVDLPPHAFPGPLVDRGKMRSTITTWFQGSDPHVVREPLLENPFVLHYTTGPTKPGSSNYPGIFQRRASSIDGPYGPTSLKLSPWPPSGLGDTCGNETFTCDKGASGDYTALFHGYRFGSRTLRSVQELYRAESVDNMANWTKTGVVIPEDPGFGGVLVMAEPSIVHVPGGSRWEGLFNVRARVGETTRTSVYRCWSDDDGVTWSYSTTPILVPPQPEESGSGYNAYTHVALVRDARVGQPTIWHMWMHLTGNVATNLKGIAQWVAEDADLNTWYPNPNGPSGLLLTQGPVGSETETTVDGPAPYLDPTTFDWTIIFRGGNTRLRGSPTLETRGLNHIRYATVA